jgi:hypothetical protein
MASTTATPALQRPETGGNGGKTGKTCRRWLGRTATLAGLCLHGNFGDSKWKPTGSRMEGKWKPGSRFHALPAQAQGGLSASACPASLASHLPRFTASKEASNAGREPVLHVRVSFRGEMLWFELPPGWPCWLSQELGTPHSGYECET